MQVVSSPPRVGEHRGRAAHAAPSSRCLLSSSRRVAALTPATGTTRIVFSPATVARTWGWLDSSIASPSAAEKPRGVKTTTRESLASIDERPAAERLLELAQAVEVGRALLLVDERAARGAHLDEPELGDVAGDGRLDDLEAVRAERVGELGLGRDLALADQAQDRALALAAVLRSRQNLLEDRDRLGDLLWAHGERGRETKRGRAGRGDEQAGVEAARRRRPVRPRGRAAGRRRGRAAPRRAGRSARGRSRGAPRRPSRRPRRRRRRRPGCRRRWTRGRRARARPARRRRRAARRSAGRWRAPSRA